MNFLRITGISLVVLAVMLPAGCPSDPKTPCTTASTRTVDGYWLATELTSDDVLADSSFVEYWYMRKVNTVGDVVQFELTDACDPSTVLVTGELSPEGYLSIFDGTGDFAQFFAQFVDDHEIEGFDWSDGKRLVAHRIQKPECSSFLDADGQGVNRQPLDYIVEDDESFAPLAVVSGKPLSAQAQEDPTLTSSAAPNGLAHLEAARSDRLPLGDDHDGPSDPAAAPAMHCTDASGNPVDCPAETDAGHSGFVECAVQNWSEAKQASLKDIVALADEDLIYPGALVQGGDFSGGTFTPITIPRAGGTLTLRGLVLSGGNYSSDVETISLANVTNAIASILADKNVIGTTADASVSIQQTYSAQHFNLAFGVDVAATGLPANVSGNLNVDVNSTDNLVVLQFTQVFYTVSFEPPQTATSVFRDGAQFDDPDNQIGEDNPPLYVANVKYGRQVFLFFRSSYGAELIKAALKGAVSAEAATVKVSGDLTYEDIMKNTRVTYVVRGGDAGLALAPLSSGKPEDLYQNVLNLLADKSAAQFSAGNPGIPISYTLRYLIGNKDAMTSYAITYDKCDCRTYPPQNFEYTLKIGHPSQSAWIYLDNTDNLIAGPYRVGTNGATLNLNDLLPDDAQHTLILQLYARCLWESAAASWDLYVDGSRRWHDSVSKGHFSVCQLHNLIGGATTLFPNEVYEARIKINPRTGAVQVLALTK